MKGNAFFKRVHWGAWLLAGCVAALGWMLHEFAFGSGVVNLSYDLLHYLRARHLPTPEAVIIYLDEKSHLDLGQPQNAPWGRALHARMIDRLTAAGARAVVMDIVFSDPNPDRAEADRQLADAIQRNGRVILGVDHIPISAFEKQFVPPFALLRTNAAAIGSVEMIPDRDLIVRVHSFNEQLQSLSWATAKRVEAPITHLMEAEVFQSPPGPNQNIRRWIQYYGPPTWIPSVSYSDALSPERVPDAVFRDKVVFIGARIITKLQNERKDEYRNPYSFWISKSTDETGARRHPFITGVEIQATQFLNLLRDEWLTRYPARVERWALIVLGALAGFGLMRLRPAIAIFVALLSAVLVTLAGRQLFVHQLVWFPFLIVLLQIGFALACAVAVNSVRLYVENRLFVRSLEMYLSPKLVKKFAAARDRRLLQPGAEKQTLTILFSDIANFTSLSEGMDSDELARLMNAYFQAAVGQCIHPTDGTVVKYIGDAIFAFWNAPEPQTDHAIRACEAALRFREQSREAIEGKHLVTRIGLHTGIANVGNFGSETRVDYTAIGEHINLASRMEGLNKFLGTQVLITGATKRAMRDQFVTRSLGRFQLKGFEKAVSVYELLGRKEDAEASRALRDGFDQALPLFQRGELHEAELAFRRILEAFPKDGPAQFYLRQIAALREEILPADWRGEVELKEK